MRRSRVRIPNLTVSKDWLCKAHWLAFTLLLEEMEQQQEQYKRLQEELNESEEVHKQQRGYDFREAIRMQDDDSKEIPYIYEPIKLEQRAILRRRYQPILKLVALHELYQDAEDLANEELEMATAIMEPDSLESIKVRLGIRAFYQE